MAHKSFSNFTRINPPGILKAFGSIFLLVTFFLQTFSTYIIEADFFLNQPFIAKTLCINKDKPESGCKGKCYLKKKLNEDQNQDQSPLVKFEKPVLLPFLIAQPVLIQKDFSLVEITFPHINETVINSFTSLIFHPPANT